MRTKDTKIRSEEYWGRSLKSYCPELSSPFLCWELLHLASTQQKRMHVSANSIQNPASYFKKLIKMDFHYYARFCSKEAQGVTWISFCWYGGVAKEERRLRAILKRQGTLVGRSPLKDLIMVCHGGCHGCQGTSQTMLWHSQQSLAKAVGVSALFCLLAGFMKLVAGFLPSVGQVCSQKCRLVAKFRRAHRVIEW